MPKALMTASKTLMLDRMLEPLRRFYAAEGVEEIAVNRPGEVFVKTAERWTEFEAPAVTYDYVVKKLCRLLSNHTRARFDPEANPVLSCELPDEPFRFQAVCGPSVRYEDGDLEGISLCVRSRFPRPAVLADFTGPEDGSLSFVRSEFVPEGLLGSDDLERLRAVLSGRLSVLVSGPVGSGRTTLLNHLLSLRDPALRIVTVEDAREVVVAQKNRTHLIVPRARAALGGFGHAEAIDAVLRLSPDLVVCGEVSLGNAQAVRLLMGKGHPVYATIHAGSPEGAKRALLENAGFAGAAFDAGAAEDLDSKIGCVVQVDRIEGRRRIVDVSFPAAGR